MGTGVEDIATERQRQIDAEGFDAEHDDAHDFSEILDAAICYAAVSRRGYSMNDFLQEIVKRLWPWEQKWWKPGDRRSNLVKSGALIAAEIDRLDRECEIAALKGN